MSHVAVILAGCGHLDGAEVREASYTLLALDQNDATFDCFAPDKPQASVMNHISHEKMPGETRNVMVEAARIARGKISDLHELDVDKYDAIIFPGGSGAAKNLSTFAAAGEKGIVDTTVVAIVQAAYQAGKPIGFVCITPACVGALCLGHLGVKLTIGDNHGVAAKVNATGAMHVKCRVDSVVIDEELRVVSTPAYMYGEARSREVYDGIKKMVDAVLAMVKKQVTA